MVFVLVALVVLALLASVHRYVWRRFVGDTTAPGSTLRKVGTVAAFALPLLSLGAMTSGRIGAPFWLQQVLAWPGFLWLAALLYLTLALLVGEFVRPVLLRVLARRDAAAAARTSVALPSEAVAKTTSGTRPRTEELVPATGPVTPVTPAPATPLALPSRRLFVSRVVGGAAAAAGLATVGYGVYGVRRGPGVRRVTVPLAKLPREAHGFRIAVVSDIHISPTLGRAHTRRVVDTVNSTSPDLVAFVGDLVDGTVADLGAAAEPLADLRAPHGVYFVTGNHEYYSGAVSWVEQVRKLGMTVLDNTRVEIAGFDLAGVDDVAGGAEGKGPDLAAALDGRDRSRAVVLLAHQPVVVHEAMKYGVDLQLSGHTHGGQLWPGNYLAALANPTLAGLERHGDTQLFVSRGAGAWGPPVRVGAPSDIAVVELASRQA
ncbi:metallophosphoesterase [Streptomyces cyaneofuscatus]